MPLVFITSVIALVFQTVAPTANIRLPHLSEVVAVVLDQSER